MRLRALACGIGFCASLLAPGVTLAREHIPPEVRDWLSGVITKIAKADHEQASSSRGRVSGTVTVRVQVAADGFVTRIEIERSSGSPDLNQRARAVIRAASPFNPPPAPLLTEAGTTELSFPLRLGR
ncbi:energy transducer TonB family protein [Methylobacterium nigriterrae]|uniref:energy transducer TonB family protein n=1 Tax=Methylobacterium nigriterrae TaxID=3127512 RepID=UPI0030140F3F